MNTLQTGDVLDEYQIERLVARSGMASIFKATDTRTGATVALKVPHPEAEADIVFFERFKREAEISQSLDHPSVIKALPNQAPSRIYLVMEWAEGRLLREILCNEKKLTVARAVRLARKICDALDYIHRNGVIHRDLKPENIMVDERDEIKLIDFGIAGRAGARRLTFGKLSELMGTPDYISPEQVKGKRGDCRSDIYALGVILYEMLTGQLPFQGPNAFVTMNARVVNHPMPPREVDPGISPQLQEILYRALERDPGRRYATACEFAHDLESPHQVGVAARSELQELPVQRDVFSRPIVAYVSLALLPVAIFLLLLLVAPHTRP